jgi:uncharacterized protein YlzI (FlbEa/FlbD family)
MTITIRETPIMLKNGKKAILQENEYEFCDDIWKLIKEFAGIYSFNINWNKILMKNHPYRLQKIICFTYTDNSRELPACHFKKDEIIVRRQFWNKINKGEFKEISYDDKKQFNIKKYNKKVAMEILNEIFGIWTLPKEFQVGDEIQFSRCDYSGDQADRAGKIISIATDRKSYKIMEYSYGEKKVDTRFNHLYDSHYIYEWDKINTKISTIKSDKGIRKGLENPTYTCYFT